MAHACTPWNDLEMHDNSLLYISTTAWLFVFYIRAYNGIDNAFRHRIVKEDSSVYFQNSIVITGSKQKTVSMVVPPSCDSSY